MSRYQNIKCFEDTLKESRSYGLPKTDEWCLSNISTDSLKEYNNTRITVENEDCVKVAEKYNDKGKVCLLNMASSWKPGGGVEKGSNAQEESLCRRSNLYLGLNKMTYPMPEFCCFYSRDVVFFKDDESNKYKLLDRPFNIDVVSMAAYRSQNKRLTYDQIEGTKLKIKTLLTVAAHHNTDIIVLSALGCGAYGNPPKLISQLFYQILEEENYKRFFKHIVFAIFDDHNSREDGNYKPFFDRFSL